MDQNLEISSEEENAAIAADAILSDNELIVPPGDPVATANLISMIDPDKIEQEDIEVIAEATGSSPTFVEKVVSLVVKSAEEADETSVEVATENYSSRISRLCARTNFSDSIEAPVGKTVEEKLTEIADILPTFDSNVIEHIGTEEIADTLSQATGIDAEAASAIVDVAKAHSDMLNTDIDEPEENDAPTALDAVADPNVVEVVASGDTVIEDEDEYQKPMTDDDLDNKIDEFIDQADTVMAKNFSFNSTDVVAEVADAWRDIKKDVAFSAHQGAKQVVKAMTNNPAYKSISSWNKTSLQPALIRVEKTVENHPGAIAGVVVAPLGLASLASLISEAVAYKAAADEEESLGNEANAEALDNAAISTTGKASIALANTARVNMSRNFDAAFANEIYSDDPRLEELKEAKQQLANGLFKLGAIYNKEQGFWSELSNFISKYSTQFGSALGATLVFMAPKFISVNGDRILIGMKEPSFFKQLSNVFNRDPAWINKLRDLDAYVKDNPKTTAISFLMALGTAVAAWLKASDDYNQPRYVTEALAQVKQAELKIQQLESELGLNIAADLAVTNQPQALVKQAFSRHFSDASTDDSNTDDLYAVEKSESDDEDISLDNSDFGLDWVSTDSDEDVNEDPEDYFVSEEEEQAEEFLENPNLASVEKAEASLAYGDTGQPPPENETVAEELNTNVEDSEAKMLQAYPPVTANQVPVAETVNSTNNLSLPNPDYMDSGSQLDAESEEETAETVENEIIANDFTSDDIDESHSFSLRRTNMRKSRYFSRWNFDSSDLILPGEQGQTPAPQSSVPATSENKAPALPPQAAPTSFKDAASAAWKKLTDIAAEAWYKLGRKAEDLGADAKEIAAKAGAEIAKAMEQGASFAKSMMVSTLKEIAGGKFASQEALTTLALAYAHPEYFDASNSKADMNAALFANKLALCYELMKKSFANRAAKAATDLADATKSYNVTAKQIEDIVDANYDLMWEAVAIQKLSPVIKSIEDGREVQDGSNAKKLRDVLYELIGCIDVDGKKIPNGMGLVKMQEVNNALDGAMKVAGKKADFKTYEAVAAAMNAGADEASRAAARSKIASTLSGEGVSKFTVEAIISIFDNPESQKVRDLKKVSSLEKSIGDFIDKVIGKVGTVAAEVSDWLTSWGLETPAEYLHAFANAVGRRSKNEVFTALLDKYNKEVANKQNILNGLVILSNAAAVTDEKDPNAKLALEFLNSELGAAEDLVWSDRKKIIDELKASIDQQGHQFSRERYAKDLDNLRRIKIAMRRYYAACDKYAKNYKNFNRSMVEEPSTFENSLTPEEKDCLADLGQQMNACNTKGFCGTSNDFCGSKKAFSKKRRLNPFSRYYFADEGEEDASSDEDVEEEEVIEEDIEEAPADNMDDAGVDDMADADDEFSLGNDEDMEDEELPEEDDWDMEADSVDSEELPEEADLSDADVEDDEEGDVVTPGIVAPPRDETEVPHWGEEGDAMDSMLGDDSIMQSEYADQYDSKPGELTLSAANAGEAMAMQNDLAVLHGVDQLKGESNFSRARRALRQPVNRMSTLQKLLGDKYLK